MQRYSREEMLKKSGAREQDLVDLEKHGLLVPNRRLLLFGRFGRREEYYTEGQLEVLRQIMETRRVVEAHKER